MSTTPTPPPPPKYIIFDLLTALLDSWSAWTLAATTALQASPSPSNSNPGTLAQTWRHHYLHLTYTHPGPYTPYAPLIHAAAALTPALPPAAPTLLLQNYTAWLRPWPEAPRVLARLREAGYVLGVVTNCSEELGHAAAKLLGEDVFAAVITAEESGWYKPAPRAYEAVLERLGVEDPREVVFVAGSAADVPGAAGVGMRVVWHNRVGMGAVGEVTAEREGRTLEEVLEGVVL